MHGPCWHQKHNASVWICVNMLFKAMRRKICLFQSGLPSIFQGFPVCLWYFDMQFQRSLKKTAFHLQCVFVHLINGCFQSDFTLTLCFFWGEEVTKQLLYGLIFVFEGINGINGGKKSCEMQFPRKPSHKNIIGKRWETMKPISRWRCYRSTSPSPWVLTGSRHGQRF